MKKNILLFSCIIFLYIIIGNVLAKEQLIPDEAIRIRVIANSDSEYDQKIKIKVKETLEKDMYDLLKNEENIEDVRYKISNNLTNIKNSIDNTLKRENYELPFTVNFGLNYFPKKEFKGIIYEEGEYESLVVTIGDGLGENWWCVLFPPLCLLEAESNETTNVEYTTMVKTIVDKYF